MENKPNIILITIDCLRADYCGWLNPEHRSLTPFLNKLAEESLVFTNAYATGPTTYLAFPGILTGTYSFDFEKWDKKNFPGLDQRPYLPKILKNNGYFSIAINDNAYLSSFFGYDEGFNVFYSNNFFSPVSKEKISAEKNNFIKKIKMSSFWFKFFARIKCNWDY